VSNVIRLEQQPAVPQVRVCGTCRHCKRTSGSWQDWHCNLYGRSTWHVRRFEECSDFEDWEPVPPKRPGFLARLGDAIIDRLKTPQ
jgi:hypothetical protein